MMVARNVMTTPSYVRSVTANVCLSSLPGWRSPEPGIASSISLSSRPKMSAPEQAVRAASCVMQRTEWARSRSPITAWGLCGHENSIASLAS